MKPLNLLRMAVLLVLLCGTGAVRAADYVSVGESSAILYDAPSLKAKKLFVVNRYMPFEQVVVLDNWVKVRHQDGDVGYVRSTEIWGE